MPEATSCRRRQGAGLLQALGSRATCQGHALTADTIPPDARRRSSLYLTRAAVENAVALVTSSHGAQKNVMTVTFFAESSHVPPLLRVAISPTCLTHELITRSGWFGLSLLADGQGELALTCGTHSGRRLDKFAELRLRHRVTENGVPLLFDCLTTSECQVIDRIELGDHTLFVGRIRESFRQPALSYRDALLVSHLVDYLGDTPGA
jgi:flavin reductase (DIM6/NTAB) family NADH-FMN oxidoreductase RutF